MKTNFGYCLTCQQSRHFEPETGLHIVNTSQAYISNNLHDICYGPFVFVEPPEPPFDWPYHLLEPSPEELAIMNQSARELEAQFESEN